MDAVDLVVAYGHWIVFAVAFVDQFGTPIPSMAILAAAGAMAGRGQLSLTAVLAAACIGTSLADVVLYQAGRWRGEQVLRHFCSFSFAPNTCVRKAEASFQRLGWKALVIAKFVPGLAYFAAPVAGALRMSFVSFLFFDAVGSLLYNLTVVGLGYVLYDQLSMVVGWFQAAGAAAIPLVVGTMLAFWGWRVLQTRHLLRQMRRRRLTPDQLQARFASGDPIQVIDLRAAGEYEVTRQTVPGATRMDPEELDDRHREISRDCDVVFLLTCPTDATRARAALALKRLGIKRVFPLEGGVEAWVSCGYPVEVGS